MNTDSIIEPIRYVLFGATGKIGRELLLNFGAAGIPVRAVTRDISKVAQLPFVTWVQADLADPASLELVLSGAKAVYLASSFANNLVELEFNLIEAGRKSGIEHIAKISTKSASPVSEFIIPRLHYQAELQLKQSGIHWTIIQPSGFMQNWLGELSQTVQRERKIYAATGDGALSFIDARDIADVAYTALTGGEKHFEKTYQLTGGKALNYFEVADTISEVINEQVMYIPVTEEDLRTRMQNKGVPEPFIHILLKMAETQRLGQAKGVTHTVQQVLGRPPRTAAEFVRDYVEWFK
jgi:uncharacterized protein YbjT (DUF2867 family)